MKQVSYGVLFLIISPLVNLPIAAAQAQPSGSAARIAEDDLPSAVNDPGLKVETVATGLTHPTAMAFLSGSSNDILVTEKDSGTVRRIIDGQVQREPVLDVAVANDNGTNERGLLGMAVAKQQQGETTMKTYVFLYYTESGDGRTGSDANGVVPAGNRLYRYELVQEPKGNENSGGGGGGTDQHSSTTTVKLINPKLLLDLPARPGPRYEGGKLLVRQEQNNSTGNTTSVYLQIGHLDKSLSQESKAENNKNGPPPDGTGGILRLDVEGNPLPNAPLVSSNNSGSQDIGMLRYYFAYGIRNGFGMAFDPVTGKLWDTENGPLHGDEINLVEPGFNSGFRQIQGGLALAEYNADINIDKDLENFGGLGKYSDPKFVWNSTVGVTAIKFLNSTKLGAEYENDMFVGDINNGRLYHFDLNQNRTDLSLNERLANKVAYNDNELKTVIFGAGFRSISDIEVGPDGYLYILEYGPGQIVRIVPEVEG
jgi:glucose/arabinose dehydrogenase